MKHLKSYVCLAALAGVFGFALTGCGSRASTSGNNVSSSTAESVRHAADRVGDAAKDVAEGVGDAAKNVTTGVGEAVDDLLGDSGFDSYADAHDYFLDTMGAYHSDARFELRNEDQALADYQEGSKGYHFNLYDTSRNSAGEKFGEFYVDANSGVIYKKGTGNTVEEYPAGRSTTSSRRTGQSKRLSQNR